MCKFSTRMSRKVNIELNRSHKIQVEKMGKHFGAEKNILSVGISVPRGNTITYIESPKT